MAGSLQDQLLKAGLADKKQSQKIKQEKRKKAKIQRTQKRVETNQTKESVQRAVDAKKEKDRELNQATKALAEKKAIAHQIAQIVEMNKLNVQDGEIVFNFTHENKIKRIYVTQSIQDNIQNGKLVIAVQGDGYAVIPKQAGDKISQRDDSVVIFEANGDDAQASTEEDDWYADFKVPDDLMW